ncbi:MAG: hypothetical protein ACRCYX_05615 [Dermatophilaceae bacterium]
MQRVQARRDGLLGGGPAVALAPPASTAGPVVLARYAVTMRPRGRG